MAKNKRNKPKGTDHILRDRSQWLTGQVLAERRFLEDIRLELKATKKAVRGIQKHIKRHR